MADVMCRHCQTRKVTRPRGLCWPCYYAPGVRAQYQSNSKYIGCHEVEDRCGTVKEAGNPTTALPGSAEKLAVMAARAKAGTELWHPMDCSGV